MRAGIAIAILAATGALGSCSSADSETTGASQTRLARDEPKSEGERVFDKWCAPCHAPGPRYPGTASLAAKYGDTMPAALEEREDLTPESVAYFVRNGVMIMPPFRKTEITDSELDELGRYLSRGPKN